MSKDCVKRPIFSCEEPLSGVDVEQLPKGVSEFSVETFSKQWRRLQHGHNALRKLWCHLAESHGCKLRIAQLARVENNRLLACLEAHIDEDGEQEECFGEREEALEKLLSQHTEELVQTLGTYFHQVRRGQQPEIHSGATSVTEKGEGEVICCRTEHVARAAREFVSQSAKSETHLGSFRLSDGRSLAWPEVEPIYKRIAYQKEISVSGYFDLVDDKKHCARIRRSGMKDLQVHVPAALRSRVLDTQKDRARVRARLQMRYSAVAGCSQDEEYKLLDFSLEENSLNLNWEVA